MRTAKLGAQARVRRGKENCRGVPVCFGVFFAKDIQWPDCQYELNMETFPTCLRKHRTGEESKDIDAVREEIQFLLSLRQEPEVFIRVVGCNVVPLSFSGKQEKLKKESRQQRFHCFGPWPALNILTLFLEWVVPV